jgi:hypothetical protein
MNRSLLQLAAALAPLFALACSSDPGHNGDGGMPDLAAGDGGGCLTTTPPTQLYQDPCVPGSQNGATFCLIDHPPTDFF